MSYLGHYLFYAKSAEIEQKIEHKYRGLRLIVPRFWHIEIELMREIGIIELLRELFYCMRVHFGRGKF